MASRGQGYKEIIQMVKGTFSNGFRLYYSHILFQFVCFHLLKSELIINLIVSFLGLRKTHTHTHTHNMHTPTDTPMTYSKAMILLSDEYFQLCQPAMCVCLKGGGLLMWDDLIIFFQSVSQFSCSVVSDSLRPNGLQHARPPCPSPTPGVYSDSCPLSR